MAMARNTSLYELLARFGPSGYLGAHAIDLERVTDGDELVAERELPARSITQAEFGAMLGAQSAALIEAADEARAEAAAAIAERDATAQSLETAQARIAALEAENAQLRAINLALMEEPNSGEVPKS